MFRKVIKKIPVFLILLIAMVLTLVISIFTIARSPSFQDLAGKVAARVLSERLHTNVRLAGIRISDMLMVQVNGIELDDLEGVPVLKAESLFLRLDDFHPSRHTIHFKKIWLHNAEVNLLVSEIDSVLSLTHILNLILVSGGKDSLASTVPWTFGCDDLLLTSVSFRYRDETKPPIEEGMDYADLAFEEIYLSARNFQMAGDSILAEVNELSCREKCGIELRQFSGLTKVSPRGISVKNLRAAVGKSEVLMDLDFIYHGYDDFSHFIDSVYIRADISQSAFNLKDIQCFAPILAKMDNPISVRGRVEGKVSDFQAEDFWFLAGLETEFSGDIRMKGLPDIYSTYAEIDFRSFYVNPQDLSNFALPIDSGYLQLPAILDTIGPVNIRGYYRGYYNDFSADIEMGSLLGSLNAQIQLKAGEKLVDAQYSGKIVTDGFDLAGLIDNPDFGLISLDAEFEGRNIEPDKLVVSLNAVVDSFDYKDNMIEGISIQGEATTASFNGELTVDDDVLKLFLSGLVDFREDQPRFDLYARVDKALLSQMKLSDRSQDMDLRFSIDADFSGIDPENFKGALVVKNLTYTENGKEYYLSHLDLVRGKDLDGEQFVTLNSDYLYAELTGVFKLDQLARSLSGFLLGSQDTLAPGQDALAAQQFTYNIIFKDITPVTTLFYSGMDIARGSIISGEFDNTKDIFDLDGTFDYIELFGMTLEALRINGTVKDQKVMIALSMDRLVFGTGDTGEVGDTLNLENLKLAVELGNDSIPFQVSWDDFETGDFTTGTILGYVRIDEQGKFYAGISHADAKIYSQPWKINPGNLVTIDSSHVFVSDLVIASGEQMLWIDGGLSRATGDTLSVSFSHWMLDNFSSLLPAGLSDIHGMVNGEIGYSVKGKSNNFFLDLGITELEFNGASLGTGFITTNWSDAEQSMAVQAELFNQGTKGRYKVVDLQGKYFPFNKSKNFDMVLTTQNLRLIAVKPFLRSFSSYFDGLSSGRVEITGTLDKPELTGTMKIQRGEITIDFTNVNYSFSHEVTIEKDKIWFKDLELYDPFSNKAVCDGSLTHRYFRDMVLDLTIRPENILAMDLTRYDNKLFYGQAFASGTVRIYGQLDDLLLDIDATTEKGTDVIIPINYYVNVSQGDFILFRNEADTMIERPEYKVYLKGFRMNFKVKVTPDASVQIYLPSNMGYIRAQGGGTLRMGRDPRGYMTMDGTYIISSGVFYFTFEQLLSRRFDISAGSSISWNGDLYDAEVNIMARYRTKTSLASLGLGMLDPSAAAQKANVNCIIYMQEKLFDPSLRFSFEFPNLNEQTKQTVFAVLDTTNMAMMNQQAISLLMLNSFSLVGGGAGDNISSAAFLSNSLSSILSQISNDFDIGVNYDPGDDLSNEELEIALSTQLFNDRLSIDGNFGVTSDESSTQKTSSIVGDVNIEYKLTPDGRFRVKAFNRPNDITVLEDYAPSTQGIGVFYRREFNRLGDLFKKKKKDK